MDYLFVICLAALFILFLSILSRNSNHISDRIFTFWLFLVALTEITFFLSSQNLFADFHLVYEVACASHVLHGTVFYFYMLSLMDGKFHFSQKHLIHLIPFSLYLGYKLVITSLGLVDCLDEGGCSHSNNPYAVISVYIKFIIILGYLSAGLFAIWKFQKNENLHKVNSFAFKWIKSVGNGVFILLSVIFAIKALGYLGVRFIIDEVMLINIIVSVFVISFLYIYSKYAYIFAHPFKAELCEKEEGRSLCESDNCMTEEQYKRICKYIEDTQAFKDGDLTLRKLATLINIPEHIISQVINRVTQRSYSDFINSYRINYFLNLIEQKEHEKKTLLYLAYECGFNSKSSFNRVFKQFYEITPSEYIKTNC